MTWTWQAPLADMLQLMTRVRLIGEPNRGLAAMFLVMNAARRHVGMQGVGHLEAVTQNAWRYAQERLQMRAAVRPTIHTAGAVSNNTTSPDPIAWHPAMHRILWTLQARTDACRLLAYSTALLLDEHDHHPDTARRAAAGGHVDLLTPVAKALFTDLGHRSADEALQVWGGDGDVHDFGIEQTVRDSRIAMIDEGTNKIQAIDQVQRKLLDDGGARSNALQAALAAEVALCRAVVGPVVQTQLTQTEAPLPGGRSASQWLQSARFGLDWLLPQAPVFWLRAGQAGAALPWLAA